jgi:hypothetical protein
MYFKALTKVVKFRMGKRLSMEGMSVREVNHKHFIIRRNRNSIRLFGMPLHSANSIPWVIRRRNAQQNTAPDSKMSSKISNSAYLKTYGTSSVIISGSSQTTNPPSDVTPANLLLNTAISMTLALMENT